MSRHSVLRNLRTVTVRHEDTDVTLILVTPISLKYRGGADRARFFAEATRSLGLKECGPEIREILERHPELPSRGEVFRIIFSELGDLQTLRLGRGEDGKIHAERERIDGLYCNKTNKFLFVVPPARKSEGEPVSN